MSTHTVHEDFAWTESVGDHPARADSPTYLAARKCMIAAVKLCLPWFFGGPPWQDHHGGGCWVRDANGWRLYKNTVGLEWSSQFCLDPVKIDLVRQNAEALVAAFPLTEAAYVSELGMSAAHLAILHKPIVTAQDVADYVDSFWNASVPLPQAAHTGVLGPNKQGAGVHHYPTPITDIAFVKHDDFVLFVTDPTSGKTMAVAPTAPRGSGGPATVQVLYHPDDPHAEGTVLHAGHPAAQQAFAQQTAAKGAAA